MEVVKQETKSIWVSVKEGVIKITTPDREIILLEKEDFIWRCTSGLSGDVPATISHLKVKRN